METIGEEKVEGEVLGEGLSEVCLELLQDVRYITMATIWLDLFACAFKKKAIFHDYNYRIRRNFFQEFLPISPPALLSLVKCLSC